MILKKNYIKCVLVGCSCTHTLVVLLPVVYHLRLFWYTRRSMNLSCGNIFIQIWIKMCSEYCSQRVISALIVPPNDFYKSIRKSNYWIWIARFVVDIDFVTTVSFRFTLLNRMMAAKYQICCPIKFFLQRMLLSFHQTEFEQEN